MNLPIARKMLKAELDRLVRDHYADNRYAGKCAECDHAAAVKAEIAAIDGAPAEVWCSRCELPSVVVREGEAFCAAHDLAVSK